MFIPETFGTALRRMRTTRALTQAALAEQAGLGVKRLSKLEMDEAIATIGEVKRLSRIFRTNTAWLRETDWVLPGARPWEEARRDVAARFRVRRPRALRRQPHSRKRFRAAYALDDVLIKELMKKIRRRRDARPLLRFLGGLPVESGCEGFFLGHVAAGDSIPIMHSVRELGFRAHAVVDRDTGLHVGDLPVPGLWLRLAPDLEVIVFCQITIRPITTGYRPDHLCAVLADGRIWWLVIEVDGMAKEADDYQKKRSDELALPIIRVEKVHLRSPDFLGWLAQQVRRLTPATARPVSQRRKPKAHSQHE